MSVYTLNLTSINSHTIDKRNLVQLQFNPFSPTVFLIAAKMSLPKRSAPYWSNPRFLIF